MRDQAMSATGESTIGRGGGGRGRALWIGPALLTALLAPAALLPTTASATPDRLQLGRFGRGGGSQQFGGQHGLKSIAFNQQSKNLLVLFQEDRSGPLGEKPGQGCIEQLNLHAGPPAVPAPFSALEAAEAEEPNLLCDPEFRFEGRTSLAVDNSSGASQGDFYVASADPATTGAHTYNVFGFAPSGTPLAGAFPIKAETPPKFAVEAAIATDSQGNLWVKESEETSPGIFATRLVEYGSAGVPTGKEVSVEAANATFGINELASDSADNLYTLSRVGAARRYAAPTYTTSQPFELGPDSENPLSLAIDHGNDHLLVGGGRTGAPLGQGQWVNEYDAAGKELTAPASPFNALHLEGKESTSWSGIAVDESNGIDYLGEAGFGYIYAVSRYGTHPLATTGAASEETDDSVRLSGTVDPEGEAATCEFQWGPTEALDNTLPCQTDPGAGNFPVPVSAVLGGLKPSSHYFYRLDGRNANGLAPGNEIKEAGTLGPVAIDETFFEGSTSTEATLSAAIDTVKQPTVYRVLYGPDESYGEATADVHLAGSPDPTHVTVTISGLQPGASYHFRFSAENAANEAEGTVSEGPDGTLATFPFPSPLATCPNQSFRVGFSTALPDCRAYELATPDLNGLIPTARDIGGGLDRGGSSFGTELGSPDGASLLFMTLGGTLPGTEGISVSGNRYEAIRGADGWSVRSSGPTVSQAENAFPNGAEPEHQYSFFRLAGGELGFHGQGFSTYLRLPDGSYRLLGAGSPESDPQASGKLITLGATHVIFSAQGQLTEESPGKGEEAVYDLTPAGPRLLSLPGQEAKYEGVSADGRVVAYLVGSVLYVTVDGSEILPVTSGTPTFAGLSADGSRLFYLKGKDLFAYETGNGETIEVTAGDADPTVVNLAPDGSDAYFLSNKQLDGAKGVAGEPNLYAWDGATGEIAFVGAVEPEDLSRDAHGADIGLARWEPAVLAGEQTNASGPGNETSRTAGDSLLFESRARLTSYDNEDPVSGVPHREIYRYDTPTGELSCVSCSPVGAAARHDAELQRFEGSTTAVFGSALIHNLSADGKRVFFETGDSLLPADGDHGVRDVYEWEAKGKGSCQSEWDRGGCLYLISSGQTQAGEFLTGNYIYSVTPSGDDVFIRSTDPLDPRAGKSGAPLLYDVRVEGGFAPLALSPPCNGDACQGAASAPPLLPGSGSSAFSGSGNAKAKVPPRCRKGKREARAAKKTSCAKRHGKRRQRRAGAERRAAR